LSKGEKSLTEFIEAYKSFVVIPDTSPDSLLAAGLLLRKFVDHGLDVRLSLDTKLLVDYPTDPAIVVSISPVNRQNHLQLTAAENSSITATVVSMLDKLVGVDKWDKLLAVLAGLYRGLYDFRSGAFRGIENTFAKELASEKVLYEVTGLRFWGAKRKSLVQVMARTFMPFIPGVTGNIDKAQKLVADVFKVSDPFSVKQKELRADESKDYILSLIKVLTEGAKDPQLAFKLLGDFYISLPELESAGEIEAHELIGGFVVYESLCRLCPVDIALSSLEKSFFSQIIHVYEVYVDRVAAYLAHQIDRAKTGEPVSGDETIKRPDIVVDTLSYINALPRSKPVKLLFEGEQVTVLRELLRVGVKPEEAYATCRDDQLCPAK